MRTRLAFAALMIAPLLLGAAVLETTTGKVAWVPAGGPADPPAVPDATEANRVQGLTVHEWGTFTSLAGPDGSAMEWLPAGGPTDLPCFIKLGGAGPKGLPATEQGGRTNKALVRMETPVIYFYSPRETTVNVKVSFPRGLITEWFPDASFGSAGWFAAFKAFPGGTSTVEWKDVRVMPGATKTYQIDEVQSHYYAARRTGSAPLKAGNDFEKFLFYRGIASFQPPLSAKVMEDGSFELENLGTEPLMRSVLFENRGGKIGYRLLTGLGPGNSIIQMPLTVLDQSFDSLQQHLEAMLRDEGMFPLEARAMVDTWRDSWFEQGTRIFYIVPSKTVDSILPLEVNPAPVQVARAFVGRMELLTPTTQKEVLRAVETGDRKTLETYGRFLEPILHDFLKDYRADGVMASIRAAYVSEVTACSKNRW